MSINWIHVAIWAVFWTILYNAGRAAYRSITTRPGKGRHSR